MIRRLLFSLGVAAAAGAVVLGLGEWSRRQAEAKDILVIPWDAPGIKYELAPGSNQNSHGYREREVPVQKPPGVKRIAVLGDSVTHGAFVPTEQIWSRMLEGRLHADGHADAQVLNFAVFGYDIESIATQLGARVLAWQPDLVVYGYYVNDAIPTELVDVGGAPMWVGTTPRDFTVVSPSLDPLLHRESALFRRWEGAVADRAVATRGQAPGDWDWFDRWADVLVSTAKNAGVPLVALMIPPHVLVHEDLATCDTAARQGPHFCEGNLAILQRATTMLAAKGVETIDGVAAYRAGPEVDLHGLPEDPHHPAAEGHRRLAEAVAPVVERRLWP